jgi:hypothetical protein
MLLCEPHNLEVVKNYSVVVTAMRRKELKEKIIIKNYRRSI